MTSGGDETVWAQAAPGARKLMRAALEAFAARGFHGASTREIAAAAGMSSTAMYAHYRTKADLLYAISLSGHQDVLAACERALDGPAGPLERMRALMREFTAWHARNHRLARVVQYELDALAAEHRAPVVELRRRIEGLFRAEIRSGLASGALHCPDPDAAALAVLSLAIDVSRWYQEGAERTPGELGTGYAELVLAMLGAFASGESSRPRSS